MKSIRIELIKPNVRKFARSPEMQAVMDGRAELIAAAAGPGFRTQQGGSRSRARAIVISATQEAILAERKNRALTRAISAGKVS